MARMVFRLPSTKIHAARLHTDAHTPTFARKRSLSSRDNGRESSSDKVCQTVDSDCDRQLFSRRLVLNITTLRKENTFHHLPPEGPGGAPRSQPIRAPLPRSASPPRTDHPSHNDARRHLRGNPEERPTPTRQPDPVADTPRTVASAVGCGGSSGFSCVS